MTSLKKKPHNRQLFPKRQLVYICMLDIVYTCIHILFWYCKEKSRGDQERITGTSRNWEKRPTVVSSVRKDNWCIYICVRYCMYICSYTLSQLPGRDSE